MHKAPMRTGELIPRSSVVLVGLVLLISGSNGGTAQPSPAGDDFQINTYTTDDQLRPSIALDAAGRFVVVWGSDGSFGTDTSGSSVQGRRFDSNGAPESSEFQVNSYTTLFQTRPAVASDSLGNFVVAWHSTGSAGSDSLGLSIQARRFGANGAPLGDDFQVNSYTLGDQSNPAVDFGSGTAFVVVWGEGGGIRGQRFSSDGSPDGSEFQVNTFTLSQDGNPSIAGASDGSFVVVWESTHSDGSDTSSWSIQARRFDAGGTPLGGPFQVNSYTTFAQRFPDVTSDGAGNFVVVWESEGSSGSDSSFTSIQAQRFAAAGAPLGAEFQVNDLTTSFQLRPTVASAPAGGFLVSWSSAVSSGTDQGSSSIQARAFDAQGDPQGVEFQVNTVTSGAQAYPAVAASPQFDVVEVWESQSSAGSDNSLRSIQGRLLSNALFRDGFESGDTAAWSVTVP